MALVAGTQFGAYQILEVLGEGGMGEVYRAYQPSLMREVALKVIRPHIAADPHFRQRFLREASILARLEHPNIVPIYEVGEVDGWPYLSSRYIRGGTLQALIGRAWPSEQVVALLAPVAEALDFAHARGFLHRDIKPANILLSERDAHGRQAPIIADFGLARLVGADGSDPAAAPLTQIGTGMGTPAYTAPEQALGRTPLDGCVDQYSLAIVAFQLLTGALPFSGASPTELLIKQVQEPPPPPSTYRPGLSRAIDAVLLRAMAKSPGDRFPDCGTFVAALMEATGSAPTIIAPPATPAESPIVLAAPAGAGRASGQPAWQPPAEESKQWARPAIATNRIAAREEAPPTVVAPPSGDRRAAPVVPPKPTRSWRRRAALLGVAALLLAAGGTVAAVIVTQRGGAAQQAACTVPAPAGQASVAAGSPLDGQAILDALNRTPLGQDELPGCFVLGQQGQGATDPSITDLASRTSAVGATFVKAQRLPTKDTDDIQYVVFSDRAEMLRFFNDVWNGIVDFEPSGIEQPAWCNRRSNASTGYGLTQCFAHRGLVVLISRSYVAHASRGNDADATALLRVALNHLQRLGGPTDANPLAPGAATSATRPAISASQIASAVPGTATSVSRPSASATSAPPPGAAQSSQSVFDALKRTPLTQSDLPPRFLPQPQREGAVAYSDLVSSLNAVGAITVNIEDTYSGDQDDIEYVVFDNTANAVRFFNEASSGGSFVPAGFSAPATCKAGTSTGYAFTQCFVRSGNTVMLSDSDVKGASRANDADAAALLQAALNHLQRVSGQ